MLFGHTKSELEQLLIDDYDDTLPKSDIVLDLGLMNSFIYIIGKYSDKTKIFVKPKPILCGCVGLTNGQPYCGCLMNKLMYQYRYEIAIEYLTRNNLTE